MKKCDVPPPGWYCTREAGHNGPCAAVPVGAPLKLRWWIFRILLIICASFWIWLGIASLFEPDIDNQRLAQGLFFVLAILGTCGFFGLYLCFKYIGNKKEDGPRP